MCALAKKVSPAKKSGNTAADTDAQLKRQSMVELLNLADTFPDHIDAVVRYVADRVRKAQQAGGGDGERFDEVIHGCGGGGGSPQSSVRVRPLSALLRRFTPDWCRPPNFGVLFCVSKRCVVQRVWH